MTAHVKNDTITHCCAPNRYLGPFGDGRIAERLNGPENIKPNVSDPLQSRRDSGGP